MSELGLAANFGLLLWLGRAASLCGGKRGYR